jgi:hypothetical protein
VVLAALAGLPACGTDDDSSSSDTPTTTADEALADADNDAADVDHGDEEHNDAAEHSDEQNADEDHDDHGDTENDQDQDQDHDQDHDDDDDHDEGSGGLDAHEHGTAEMTVAWIDGDVAIDLISPTFNVFGFEYEPTSDEDLAIEMDRTAALTSTSVVTINDEAMCTLTDPVGTAVERDGSHSEITVSWLFECENADGISQVDASGLFDEFPNFDDIDVQWISESEQSSAELSPTETTVTLRR